MHSPMKLLALLGLIVCSKVSGDSLTITVIDSWQNGTLEKTCSAAAAMFGPTDDFYGITGVIVNASPVNGCLPMQPPPYRRNDSLTWVVLVARDRNTAAGCYFDRKVFNAQAAGFGAALIYNYEDSVSNMQASSLADQIVIPAAMVTQSCGMRLQQQFAYSPLRDSRYTVTFKDSFSFNFSVYVISFVSIICGCFLLFTLLWVVRCFRDWRFRQRSRLSRSSLRKLKVKKFVKGTDPYDCCAICLEDYEPGDKLRILPCNHAYHVKCIDPWLLRNRSVCPVCKRRVFPGTEGGANEDPEEGGASATANAPNAAAAAVVTSSAGQGDGERTPLLGASPTGSASSLAAQFAGGARAYDNPALRLHESPTLTAVANATAAAAAAAAAAASSGPSSRSGSVSSVSSCSSEVSSLPVSEAEAAAAAAAAAATLAVVCVHSPADEGAQTAHPDAAKV